MSINILGGGISGLTASVNLTNAGKKVTVFEKTNCLGGKPNHYFCALRNYDLEVDAIEELNSCGIKIEPEIGIKRVLRYSPTNKYSEIRSSAPIFYILSRGERQNSIENQLLKQVDEYLFNIKFNATIADKFIRIVASGPRTADVLAYGFTFSEINAEKNTVYLFYNNNFAPAGYICLLPSKNEASIFAVCFDKNCFKILPQMFEKALKSNTVLSQITHNAKRLNEISGFGSYQLLVSSLKNEKYYVGEAAGFQDASKGFGIRYAILSGYLVARSIIEGTDYNHLCRLVFGKELDDNLKKRKLLDTMDNNHYEKFIEKLKKRTDLDTYIQKRKNIG